HRDVLHVLDAAGDLHVLAAGGHAHRRLVDRLERRAAQPVDGTGPGLDRHAGDEGRHAGDVVALLVLLLDAAPVDVLDQRAGHAGALEEGADQVGRQVVGPGVAEHPLLGVGAADGRAGGVDDHGGTHGKASEEMAPSLYGGEVPREYLRVQGE